MSAAICGVSLCEQSAAIYAPAGWIANVPTAEIAEHIATFNPSLVRDLLEVVAALAYMQGSASSGFSWPDPNYEALRAALAALTNREPG